MHELRPDLFTDDDQHRAEMDADDRVIAPGETADGRDSGGSGFRVDERISGAGTGYQPNDPAEGGL